MILRTLCPYNPLNNNGGILPMLSVRTRFDNSIREIMYSDAYEKNHILFDKGIELLQNRIKNNDWSDFTSEELEVLENIFSII